MSGLGEQMERKAFLNTTGSSATLFSVASCNIRFDKSRKLSLLVIAKEHHNEFLGRKVVDKTHRISRCFPVSITHVISGMVTPVSGKRIRLECACHWRLSFFLSSPAMLVARSEKLVKFNNSQL